MSDGVGASDEDCNVGNLFPPCEEEGEGRCTSKNSFCEIYCLMGLRLKARLVQPLSAGSHRVHRYPYIRPGQTRPGIPVRYQPAEGLGFAVDRLLAADHPVAGAIRRFSPGGWLVCGRKPIPALRSSMHCNAGKPCNQRLATSNPIFCRRPSRKYRYPRGFDSTCLRAGRAHGR